MSGEDAAPVPALAYRDDFWRSLFYFNVYRCLVPVVLVALWMFDSKMLFGSSQPSLFIWSMGLYA
ncbi:MAG: hypothetical protein K2W80_15890, partial [Burkholderiales bacterium]|nr:hypothetical protein [Burkholderiales bacterium]